MADAPGPLGTTITDNGIRFVGAAARLFREVTPVAALVPGRSEDSLFGLRVTLRAWDGGSVIDALLPMLRQGFREAGADVPPLKKGTPVSVPADRYTGLKWHETVDVGAWTGQLLCRTRHPTVPGEAITHHIVLEERKHFDRFTLLITADRGLESVRAPVGAGQVRPGFLDEMASRFEVSAWGAPVAPRMLSALEIPDFVQSLLLSPGRTYPVALLAPLEGGGYALDPESLSRELLGVAPLYVVDEHSATFRLTDLLRDKRLSCFFGALRFYMPGFTAADDPYDHPLLVHDRLLDPVMRAADLGRAAIYVGRLLSMPEIPGARRFSDEDGSPNDEPMAGFAGAEATEQEVASEPSSAVEGAAEGPAGEGLEQSSDGTGPADAPSPASQPVPSGPSLPSTTSEAPSLVLAPDLLAFLERGLEVQERMVRELRGLSEEVKRLRTLTAVRSAGTASLERRIGRMQDELEARLPPVESTDDAGAIERPSPDPAADADQLDDADSDDLQSIVQSAARNYADVLLVLPEAETSAADSPYEDAERVGAVLDAMAFVAQSRMEGGLGVSLREAFRDLGVDYRGGISEATSARQREQYRFRGPEGEDYDCVEHIALGNARDPRHCLRIYFTSRAKAENRFVIGHVGRHFDVRITD